LQNLKISAVSLSDRTEAQGIPANMSCFPGELQASEINRLLPATVTGY